MLHKIQINTATRSRLYVQCGCSAMSIRCIHDVRIKLPTFMSHMLKDRTLLEATVCWMGSVHGRHLLPHWILFLLSQPTAGKSILSTGLVTAWLHILLSYWPVPEKWRLSSMRLVGWLVCILTSLDRLSCQWSQRQCLKQGICSVSMWLITQEDFITFIYHENLWCYNMIVWICIMYGQQ